MRPEMRNIKLINRNYRKDGEKILIKSETEQTMTVPQIMNTIMAYERRKEEIKQQIIKMFDEIKVIDNEVAFLNEMLENSANDTELEKIRNMIK